MSLFTVCSCEYLHTAQYDRDGRAAEPPAPSQFETACLRISKEHHCRGIQYHTHFSNVFCKSLSSVSLNTNFWNINIFLRLQCQYFIVEYFDSHCFSCPRMRPRTLRSPPVAAEGDTSQEVPTRQRRRTWRRLLHISATHWSMELRRKT